jgi:hypothetical protein
MIVYVDDIKRRLELPIPDLVPPIPKRTVVRSGFTARNRGTGGKAEMVLDECDNLIRSQYGESTGIRPLALLSVITNKELA